MCCWPAQPRPITPARSGRPRGSLLVLTALLFVVSNRFEDVQDGVVLLLAWGQRNRERGVPDSGSSARWTTMMAAPITPPVSPERDWVIVRCCVASGVDRW